MTKTKSEVNELEKARKQLESLEKEMVKLSQALAGAESKIVTLGSLVRTVFKRCPGCGSWLHLIDWNTETYMLICDNKDCKNWRQPAGSIKKNDLDSIISPPEDKGKYQKVRGKKG